MAERFLGKGSGDGPTPRLVPEFDVLDLAVSLAFYVGILEFELVFERPAERFAYLDLDGAHLMLEEATGPGRRFHTAALEYPFGRGVNLQIAVSDVEALYERTRSAGCAPVIALEERRYQAGSRSILQRQFVVRDPDGYLLRFSESVDSRPGSSAFSRSASC